MLEPPPSCGELDASTQRADERGYPGLEPPLTWGQNFAKRGFGICCACCELWVGWAKINSNGTTTDDSGWCEHYTAASKHSLVQRAIADWNPDRDFVIVFSVQHLWASESEAPFSQPSF